METQWIQAADEADVPDDDVIGVAVQSKNLALAKVEGEVFAFDNICTHGNARLCDGFLDGHEIECPLHQGKFDVRTGKALCDPLTEDTKTYPVKIEAGVVFVQI